MERSVRDSPNQGTAVMHYKVQCPEASHTARVRLYYTQGLHRQTGCSIYPNHITLTKRESAYDRTRAADFLSTDQVD